MAYSIITQRAKQNIKYFESQAPLYLQLGSFKRYLTTTKFNPFITHASFAWLKLISSLQDIFERDNECQIIHFN